MAEHADTTNGQLSDPAKMETETKNIVAEPDSSGTAPDVADDTLDPDEADYPRSRFGPLTVGVVTGLAMVVALGGLSGWLGYRAHQSHQAQQRDAMFLQVARQGAVNLTTIDWEHPQADVQRILDSSTGHFRDDFGARAQPFIDAVTKLQSKSLGTVTDAGIESISGDQAQVMVAMSVKTSIAAAPEQQPRSWRMRISVQTVGVDTAKVSEVAFVP